MKKKITVIAVLSTIILLLLGANYICFLSPNSLFGRKQEIIQETIVENVQQESTSEENAKSTPPVINFDELSASKPAEEIPPVEETKEYDLQLMAVGDNLIHMGIIYSGLQDDGTYQYDFMFDGIRDFLAISDIKIINQETPIAGNELGFSGYPTFNSPIEIGDAIAKAGFNIVLGASNHSADQKISGIDSMVLLERTAEVLREHGWKLGNLDATIIAQAPKMAPHIQTMRENIAKRLDAAPDAVSIKATTEEHLGFTGAGEGIAAHAVCLIERI